MHRAFAGQPCIRYDPICGMPIVAAGICQIGGREGGGRVANRRFKLGDGPPLPKVKREWRMESGQRDPDAGQVPARQALEPLD